MAAADEPFDLLLDDDAGASRISTPSWEKLCDPDGPSFVIDGQQPHAVDLAVADAPPGPRRPVEHDQLERAP